MGGGQVGPSLEWLGEGKKTRKLDKAEGKPVGRKCGGAASGGISLVAPS